MINPTREQVAVALFALLNTGAMQAVFPTISRRPQLWQQASAKPALYMGQPLEESTHRYGTATPAEIAMDFDIFIYIATGQDPNVAPDTAMNNCIDALEAAILGPPPNYVQTLGLNVNHVYIEGPIHRAPGYLDGQGMCLLTIRVLVPT